MSKRRLLVFGATGYVGRYLCCRLKELGHDFLAIGRSPKVAEFFAENGIPFVKFDLNGNVPIHDVIEGKSSDVIVNLAACLAEHETPVERFFEVNTIGTYRLLEFARYIGTSKYVMTTSHKVYNDVDVPAGTLISEDVPLKYRGDHTPYIISKVAAENFVEYYNRDFGMDGICLRLTGVHGYGEILGHLTADGHYKKSTFEIFFEKALHGDTIEVWGDQSVKRDHVYIKDVVSAIIAAAGADNARGIFNIASGVGYSQYEEACVLAKVFSKDKVSSVVCVPEKPGLKHGYVYDISKAKSMLGWAPAYADLQVAYEDYKQEWKSKKFHNYHKIKSDEAPLSL